MTTGCRRSAGPLFGVGGGGVGGGGLAVLGGLVGAGADEASADDGGKESEQCAGEEREVVAAVEGGQGVAAVSEQVVGAGGGEAGQHGQAKSAAHHERGVNDAGGQA